MGKTLAKCEAVGRPILRARVLSCFCRGVCQIRTPTGSQFPRRPGPISVAYRSNQPLQPAERNKNHPNTIHLPRSASTNMSAEKDSNPPPAAPLAPVARTTRPLSETLLNDKVRRRPGAANWAVCRVGNPLGGQPPTPPFPLRLATLGQFG